MNRVLEQIQERKVILADGRYLIFYSFGTSDPPVSSKPTAEETPPATSSTEEY